MSIDKTTAVGISKLLSFWLRHRPDEGDLVLDGEGWTSVEAVLKALEKAGRPASPEALRHVVDTSEKKRFELSPDGARLRARQGHSVEVQGDWVAAPPPEVLFHGTVERFLPAIRQEGLRPMARHHVHLSPDIDTARQVGGRRGDAVILRVLSGEMARAGHAFFRTGNGVWLAAAVPPEFLENA
ncbi:MULTISPECIES: RNA 2'-phosphotransferase [unclassified Caulobacter]|uniref:RNA 2'-phosphotransferase n=1 Tax=unclassified Caulobacter TaxID=2648921 RepID=UPI0004A74AF0|nr:RNA 2'-phosphotransferase [Caulobacter sp. UNC358MFTsu5.1]